MDANTMKDCHPSVRYQLRCSDILKLYDLSNSSLFDVIVMYCLSHGLYDVAQIDAILFQYDQETLYSKA